MTVTGTDQMFDYWDKAVSAMVPIVDDRTNSFSITIDR
jgi:hypothetical protein